MTPDTRWQRSMIGGLGLHSLFESAQLGIPEPTTHAEIKPTLADIAHAVANTRAWRVYLPPPCVAAMIKDGWHWST